MKNPVSTITGIALAVLSIVSAVGLITAEQNAVFVEWIPTLVEGIAAIVALFASRDGGASLKNL